MLSKAELNLSTDALTVEQAIEHALAVYEQNDCNMCGRQHKQLANWLTELLSLREQLAELKEWATNRAITDDARENENYTTLKIDYRQRQLRELLKTAKPAED
ncbi:hypothetical protein [Yersinia enterocolitica]|uniref:hypothetical protein n=1 Tax=Yersinia enterocolitica TaxID=630 RepID=UPI003D07BD82